MSTSILDDENLLTFGEAAKALPRRRGGAVASTSTLWRWSRHGSRGVKLETVHVGGQCYIHRDALVAFIEERSRVGSAPQAPSPTVASERAVRALERMDAR
jgi:hypothetical protein